MSSSRRRTLLRMLAEFDQVGRIRVIDNTKSKAAPDQPETPQPQLAPPKPAQPADEPPL